jgi:hypothetical protein
VNLPGIYLDEDAQSTALIHSLRARGLRVLTTTEAGMPERPDEEQLRFATANGLVLVTYNIADFARIHDRWLSSGLEHAGIILVQQQKWGPGELVRRIVRLLAAVPGGTMRNRLEFISNW